MTRKTVVAALTVMATGLLSGAASAAINQPPGHQEGNSYEECTVPCTAFIDAHACRQFRQAKLICTAKKKSTWPILSAQAPFKIQK